MTMYDVLLCMYYVNAREMFMKNIENQINPYFGKKYTKNLFLILNKRLQQYLDSTCVKIDLTFFLR